MRFEYCLEGRGERQYVRSIQGDRGVPEVDSNFYSRYLRLRMTG